jgi:hypothetical protein
MIVLAKASTNLTDRPRWEMVSSLQRRKYDTRRISIVENRDQATTSEVYKTETAGAVVRRRVYELVTAL